MTTKSVRQSKKTTSQFQKTRVMVFVLGAAAVFLTLVQIYFSGRVAVTGERIKALQSKRDQLVLRNAKLQDRINAISSLAYIEEKAREELKMVSGVDSAWYLSSSEIFAQR